MADRLLVPYKSSYLRVSEAFVVLAVTFGLAEASRWLFPDVSSSYMIIVSLAVGYFLVPRLGDAWAVRHGATLMTKSERTRRYLSELGPIGPPDTGANLLATTQHVRLRRSGSKQRHRRRA